MSAAPLAVLIPAYQAETTIASVIQGLRIPFHEAPIFVVDDGSSDATAAVALSEGAEVFSSCRNQGKGHALQLGFEILNRRGFEHVICVDADGQHHPDDAFAVAASAQSMQADLVLGDRSASFAQLSYDRQLSNRLSSFWLSRRVPFPLSDSQCGLRALSMKFASAMRAGAFDFSFESHMILEAARLNVRVHEVPVQAHPTGAGSHIHRLRDSLRFLKLMLWKEKKVSS
jgi:glycosyltransferase involved in cell wall biosynthesis